MLSNFYTTQYSVPPQSGVYTTPSDLTGMNTSLNFLIIILPFLIAVGMAFCRNHLREFQQDETQQDETQQDEIQQDEIQHQREILERIWQMQARK
jgi:hypothetical protein